MFDTTVTEPTHSFATQPEIEHPPGTVIGRYNLIERLGAGSIGVVYLAYDFGLERQVGDRATAEDILQSAFVRASTRVEQLRDDEAEGVAVKDYAQQAAITANNAGVRVFRAREALRKQVMRSCGTCAEHGCIDCSCKSH